jgi:hypothetical protein
MRRLASGDGSVGAPIGADGRLHQRASIMVRLPPDIARYHPGTAPCRRAIPFDRRGGKEREDGRNPRAQAPKPRTGDDFPWPRLSGSRGASPKRGCWIGEQINAVRVSLRVATFFTKRSQRENINNFRAVSRRRGCSPGWLGATEQASHGRLAFPERRSVTNSLIVIATSVRFHSYIINLTFTRPYHIASRDLGTMASVRSNKGCIRRDRATRCAPRLLRSAERARRSE